MLFFNPASMRFELKSMKFATEGFLYHVLIKKSNISAGRVY